MPTKILSLLAALSVVLIPSAVADNSAPVSSAPAYEPGSLRLGYTQPYSKLKGADKLNFRLGQAIFEKIWVSSPSSTTASDGLGPYFNARACVHCHPRNGRAQAAWGDFGTPLAATFGTVFHLSEQSEQSHTQAHPVYGNQLQSASVASLPIEARATVQYTPRIVTLADQTQVELRVPSYTFSEFSQGAFNADTRFSPRLAPAIYGLGVLSHISDDDIRSAEDPNDHNNDGISGRINWVTDRHTGQPAIGRFGLKANHPSVAQQNAVALHNDIGLSNPMFTDAAGDCSPAQPLCKDPRFSGATAPHNLEVPHELTEVLDYYTLHLKAPLARNKQSPAVEQGKKVFYDIGCQQCHRSDYPSLNTLDPRRVGATEPYTDLLLHDMGPALADQRKDHLATGQEWRTPALWGIGLTERVLGYQNYLHDGRARTLLEAVLWHGGEASRHQQAVIELTTEQRNALISFLESL